jgi:alpha-tubulin suppressor-like RCC1 family protein
MRNHTVECWGSNSYSGLGDGTTHPSFVPITVSGIKDAIAVAIGGYFSYALLKGGTVQSWGDISDGESTEPRFGTGLVPFTIHGITNAAAIAVGSRFGCAVVNEGKVRCWAHNASRSVAQGTIAAFESEPVTISGVFDAVSIAVGFHHACAVLKSGAIQCWRDNSGDASDVAVIKRISFAPVKAPDITNAISLAAGMSETCVVAKDGRVQCWHDDSIGIFYGASESKLSELRTIPVITDAVAVTVGTHRSCAIRNGGIVACWRNGAYGELRQESKHSDSTAPATAIGF